MKYRAVPIAAKFRRNQAALWTRWRWQLVGLRRAGILEDQKTAGSPMIEAKHIAFAALLEHWFQQICFGNWRAVSSLMSLTFIGAALTIRCSRRCVRLRPAPATDVAPFPNPTCRGSRQSGPPGTSRVSRRGSSSTTAQASRTLRSQS
jgi:hypothetical protein